MPSSVQFQPTRLHHLINVAFQHYAPIDDGCDFIDYLGGSETGIRDYGDTEKQAFPVLLLFPFQLTALRITW
ncbi:hypothetical protein ACLK1S_00350 [Escherichia coli]